MPAPTLVRVWDPVVRVGHWTLVGAFAVAYLTEDDLLSVHVWAGYVIGIILVIRLAWGFVGPRYARFTDFVRGPGAVLGYLRDLLLFRARRYVGHSPGGGAMVIALILCLGATVVTGLMAYGKEEQAGPLAPLFASEASNRIAVIPPAAPGENERRRMGSGEQEDEALEEMHDFFAKLTLILITFHVAGVLLASFVHRENLIGAMINGNKRSELGGTP
jgi:cytochrome b